MTAYINMESLKKHKKHNTYEKNKMNKPENYCLQARMYIDMINHTISGVCKKKELKEQFTKLKQLTKKTEK